MRYETPVDVARVLARHAPRNASSILDPAVGHGALLRPLITRIANTVSRVVCVDTDKSVLPTVVEMFGNSTAPDISCVHFDFLSWSENRRSNEFDCVVMNPPFAAKKDNWVSINLRNEFRGCGKAIRYGPIEIAFVCRAIRLLRPGGRLLAVVPTSVVAGETTRVFRDVFLKAGAVRYVHELPHFSFETVESRMYMFVFDKGQQCKTTILCNHDLHEPERMSVSAEAVQRMQRFDFGYFRGRERLQELLNVREYEWMSLSRLATTYRGSAKSPRGPRESVHTCDYRAGLWHRASRHRLVKGYSGTRVKSGDILVKRVGRYCSQSFGRTAGVVGMKCSDCVLILRPNVIRASTELLFAIRCMVGFPWAASLVEKGTGASYITEHALATMMVPTALHKKHSLYFARYRAAVARRSFREMRRIEQHVQARLMNRAKKGERA